MNLLKPPAILAICIGLVLPSAHSVAVCLDGEGSFTLEAAVNGACAGLDSRCCEDEAPRYDRIGADSCSADHCGGCHDIVIGGAGIGSPMPTHEKARRTSRPTSDTPLITGEELSVSSLSGGRTFQAFRARIAERSPPESTSVLRL